MRYWSHQVLLSIKLPIAIKYILFWLVKLSLLVGPSTDLNYTKSESYNRNDDIRNEVDIDNKVNIGNKMDNKVFWVDRLLSINLTRLKVKVVVIIAIYTIWWAMRYYFRKRYNLTTPTQTAREVNNTVIMLLIATVI